MTRKWFYSADSKIYVEKTRLELMQLQKEDKFTENSYIWTHGFVKWEHAEKVSDLLALVEQESPPEAVPETQIEPSNWFKKMIQRLQASLKQGERLSRLWWLVCLPYIVPIVGAVVFRGWRLDLMRRHEKEGFPESRKIGHHLSDGLFLWGVYLLYLLPGFLLIAVFATSWLDTLLDLLEWIFQKWLTQTTSEPISAVLADNAVSFVIQSILISIYPILVWPFHRGAVMRYAFWGKKKVFWEFRKNFNMLKQHRGTFLYVFFEDQLLGGVALLVSAILLFVFNIIGIIPVTVILIPLKTAVSGWLYRTAMERIFPMSYYFPQ